MGVVEFMRIVREVIIARILDACINSSSKTGIVYKIKLSFSTVNPFLETIKKKVDKKLEVKDLLYKMAEKDIDFLRY
jgi:predicted transcriptional regulator